MSINCPLESLMNLIIMGLHHNYIKILVSLNKVIETLFKEVTMKMDGKTTQAKCMKAVTNIKGLGLINLHENFHNTVRSVFKSGL
jgi:hypothetical protein